MKKVIVVVVALIGCCWLSLAFAGDEKAKAFDVKRDAAVANLHRAHDLRVADSDQASAVQLPSCRERCGITQLACEENAQDRYDRLGCEMSSLQCSMRCVTSDLMSVEEDPNEDVIQGTQSADAIIGGIRLNACSDKCSADREECSLEERTCDLIESFCRKICDGTADQNRITDALRRRS